LQAALRQSNYRVRQCVVPGQAAKGPAAMSFEDFRASIASERLRNVAEHWRSAKGARRMPGWKDIRPSRIAAELPLIWTYRYDAATDSFTGRLAGDTIERVLGQSFRGTPMAVLYAKHDYSEFFARCKRVVCEPSLSRSEGTVFKHVDRYGIGERIVMPLADNGENGDGVLGATVYDSHRGAPAEDALEALSWFPIGD
jgi:hypothetical protein